jgi:hypothetical protein
MKTGTMRANSTSRLTQFGLAQFVLAGAMVAGAALAHAAAPGFTVQARDQQLVKVGMTQDEVRAALGKPARTLRLQASSATTWTYQRPEVEVVFDVDFGSDGKVITAGERRVYID